MPLTIVVDLSNTLDAGGRSGIQRVALPLVDALERHSSVEVVRTDGRTGELRPLGPAARWRLGRDDLGEGVAARIERRLARRPRRATIDRDRLATDPGRWFLDVDAAWHSPVPRGRLLAGLVARGVPTAAVVYDVLPLTDPDWFPPSSVERFSTWFDAHRSAGSLLLGGSGATAAAIEEIVGHPVPVLPLGPTRPPAAAVDAGATGITMIGTVEPRKGHDLLLDALDRLADAAPCVDVIGRAGWADDALVERLRRHPAVRWHPDADDGELEAILARTGLLLQPSRGEGYGLPVVEALRRGIRVAAADIPVLVEVGAGRAHHLPLDATAWADTLRRFADVVASGDETAWPRPEPVEPPSWDDVAATLVHLLEGAR